MSIARCVSAVMKLLEKLSSLYSNIWSIAASLRFCALDLDLALTFASALASLKLCTDVSTKSSSLSSSSKMTCVLLPVSRVFFEGVKVSAGVEEVLFLGSAEVVEDRFFPSFELPSP